MIESARFTRASLLVGIACLLGACAGSTSDGDGDSDGGAIDVADTGAVDGTADAEPDVIRTGEPCMVSADCMMTPRPGYCPEPRKAIRYEPVCGADHRCAWERYEESCGLTCEDGICITARR